MEDRSIFEDRLRDFCFYFLKQVEHTFGFYLNILEEDSKGANSTSKTGMLLASASGAIPTVGKGIGSLITSGDKYVSNRSDKRNALRLSALLYEHARHLDASRSVLIEAAYEIFCAYEGQFMQVNCNGGVTRAIEKLGYDAAERLVKSVLKDEEVLSAWTKREMIERIVEFDTRGILHDLGLFKVGRMVRDKQAQKWSSADIYLKVGVVKDECFYDNEKCDTSTYGYRRAFSFETHEQLRKLYALNDQEALHMTYMFDASDFGAYHKAILNYYYARTDSARADRERKQEELVSQLNAAEANATEDRQVKHAEAQQHRDELHTELKDDHRRMQEHEQAILSKLEEVRIKQAQDEQQMLLLQEAKVIIDRERVRNAFKDAGDSITNEFERFRRRF